jgi:hypothetical protein
MKRYAGIVIILVFAAGLALAESKYAVQDKELIQKTLKFQDTSKPGELSLDNVFGSIRVEGSGGAQVELTANKTIRAVSKDRVQQAKDEVKLDIKEKGNAVEIYVDGPFRCQCQDGRGYKWRDVGYEVQYDFVLKVPRRTRLVLNTVNEGDILVNGIEGPFEVNNVNGRVDLADMSGSGRAGTVNGGVKATFLKNPSADCSFSTINGEVELALREGLSAEFNLKTMNGEAFSDFETLSLPAKPGKVEQHEGKFVYHHDQSTRVRAGKGGPVLSCDTLNGNIYLRKYKAD